MAEADGKPAVKMLQGEAYWHGVAHGKTYGEREIEQFLGFPFLSLHVCWQDWTISPGSFGTKLSWCCGPAMNQKKLASKWEVGSLPRSAPLYFCKSNFPRVSEDLALLSMERVTALVSNYKEKGFVYQLATYLREWQQDGSWDCNDFGYQHLCFHRHLHSLFWVGA